MPLDETDQETQKNLNRTTDLILNLQQTQYERLSEKLPEHLAYVKDPSNDEINLGFGFFPYWYFTGITGF